MEQNPDDATVVTSELFTFVEYSEVPSENNAAERAIRPFVIARKVSGCARFKKGSNTKTVLRSLFGTWQAQGLDLLQACQNIFNRPRTQLLRPLALTDPELFPAK
jgi:hypothetical protein